MKCRKCGAQMGDDMLYCPVCGTHIPTSADEISDDDVALYIKEEKLEENRRIKEESEKKISDNEESDGPSNNYGDKKDMPPQNRNTVLIVLISVLIVLVLMGISGGLAFVFMNDHSDTLKNSLEAQNNAARQTGAPVTPSPEPMPSPEPTPVQTTNIKVTESEQAPDENPSYRVYTDPEYHFSCSYPSSFEVYIDNSKSGRYTLRSADGTASLRICAEENSAGITVAQSLDMFKAQTGGYVDYEQSGETYYAVRMVNGSNCVYKYLRSKNGNMYWFEFTFPRKYFETYDKYINHLYSSFTVN